MKLGYLDCFSGISGNMLLGALVSAGLPEHILKDIPQALKLDHCLIEIQQEDHNGLQACSVIVQSDKEQPHRHLADIESIICSSDFEDVIQEKALSVFQRIAHAEAAVHGCLPEEVHFHEVGAVDAIVDIVGAVSGFAHLGIQKIICSPLPLGRGWVSCDHGELPLPAPAVCNLLQDVPVYGESLSQELVTPTGAALACELADGFGEMEPMLLQKVGYGAGSMQRADRRPNLLRLLVGTSQDQQELAQVLVIETHLDDWNGEQWPHVSDLFMQAGALDVSLAPVHMKKGRPGFLLRLVCDPADKLRLSEFVFNETSSIGLRYRLEQRMTLPRRSVTVQTRFGTLVAKEIDTPQGTVITPEYEICRQVAQQKNVSLQAVYQAVLSGSREK